MYCFNFFDNVVHFSLVMVFSVVVFCLFDYSVGYYCIVGVYSDYYCW